MGIIEIVKEIIAHLTHMREDGQIIVHCEYISDLMERAYKKGFASEEDQVQFPAIQLYLLRAEISSFFSCLPVRKKKYFYNFLLAFKEVELRRERKLLQDQEELRIQQEMREHQLLLQKQHQQLLKQKTMMQQMGHAHERGR